jgi:hypothetical protein
MLFVHTRYPRQIKHKNFKSINSNICKKKAPNFLARNRKTGKKELGRIILLGDNIGGSSSCTSILEYWFQLDSLVRIKYSDAQNSTCARPFRNVTTAWRREVSVVYLSVWQIGLAVWRTWCVTSTCDRDTLLHLICVWPRIVNVGNVI